MIARVKCSVEECTSKFLPSSLHLFFLVWSNVLCDNKGGQASQSSINFPLIYILGKKSFVYKKTLGALVFTETWIPS